MQLNEVIRHYRKEQNLTQEQLANYLGVTAPAVNKWENGISYPDITLLPPLARVLKTDVNTLLSFHEDLTGQEIDQIILDLTNSLNTEGYSAAFTKGESYIHEYAACDSLVLSITQILYGYLGLLPVEDPAPYKSRLLHWYELLLDSKNFEVRNAAASSLSQSYINNEQYDKARQLIDSIPQLKLDKRLLEAQMYLKQNDHEKAYAVYEHMLLDSATKTYSILISILEVLCMDKNDETVSSYAALASKTAGDFGLGSFEELTPPLLCAAMQKDTQKTLDALQTLITNLDSASVTSCPLYSHIAWKKDDFAQKKQFLKQAFDADHSFDFIRDNSEFIQLIHRL